MTSLSPLTSTQVKAFLPLNTWTEVKLFSRTSNCNDVYIITTADRQNKMIENMKNISLHSSLYERVVEFKYLKIVGVKIEDKWFRGKLISYNEFMCNDTVIELIDFGYIYATKMQNVFILPYYFNYDPLALPVKFKNFIPKTTRLHLSIKPLLSESFLHEGVVLVDVDYNTLDNAHEGVHLDTKIEHVTSNDDSLLSDWILQCQKKPKYIPLKNKDNCKITFFKDFSCIYVCKIKHDETNDIYDICNLDNKLKTEKSTDKIHKNYPVVGDIVKVFSSKHNGLYRAKVLRNNKNGSYKVFYIDYGNMETVMFDVIYELADELKKKPGLAVKVRISELKHIKVNKQIKNMFNAIAADEEQIFMIEFDETSNNCLEDVKLKDIKCGCYINSSYIKKCLSTKSEISNNIKNNDVQQRKDNLSNNFQSIMLENGDYCIISYFKDFKNIYVCKAIKDTENTYVMHNIDVITQTILSSGSNIKITNLVIGDIVKVFSQAYSGLFRGKITNIENDDIQIFYIDFGNTEIVHSSNIFELSDELKKETKLPIRVSLKVSSNAKETDAIKDLFSNLIENKVVLSIKYEKKTTNGLENVLFKDLETGNSVNNEVLKLLPVKKLLQNGEECYLTHFETFNQVYILKVSDLNIINIITDGLNNADSKLKANPVIRDIVKVKSPLFNKYFRAIILFIENDNFFVYYIDYGNREVVKSIDIFELPENLKKKPDIIFEVGLNIPWNVKKSNVIKNMFTNLTDEKLSIEFDEFSLVGLKNCTLKIISSGLNINYEILRLSSQSSVFQNKGLNNQIYFEKEEHVEVLHVKHALCIFIRSIKLHEKFKAILEKLRTEKSDNLQLIYPKIHDIVAVFSSRYRGIYRAKIISQSTLETNKYNCVLIDNGQYETIVYKNIFMLPNYIISNKIPFIGFKISLFGLKKVINSELVSYLSSLVGKTFIFDYNDNSRPWYTQVILKELNSHISLNDKIQHMFANKSINMSLPDTLKKKVVMPRIEKSAHPIRSGSTIYITHFKNFDSIYVRDASYEFTEAFNTFNKNMLLYYSNASNNIRYNSEMLNVGEIVCVRSLIHLVMYCRAVIINKNGNEYNVFHLDYGSNELVNAEYIFELSREFSTAQNFVFKIQLKNMPQFDIKEDNIVNDYFKKKLIFPKTFLLIEFNENNPLGLDDVILKIELTNKNIADIINNLIMQHH